MAQSFRNRPFDIGRERGRFLTQRFGRELRVARIAAGVTQRDVARSAGVSQALVSLVERGASGLTLDVTARLAAAVGGDVSLTLYPGRGVGLRDSGQLRLAEIVRAHVHKQSRVEFEVPVGEGTDRRAADMVVETTAELQLLEIERSITDFQAQYRSAQLKRRALAEHVIRPVRLVWVVGDTRRNRRVLGEHAEVVASVFPLTSRPIWAALADGQPFGADGLLWLRERERRELAGVVTGRASAHSRAS